MINIKHTELKFDAFLNSVDVSKYPLFLRNFITQNRNENKSVSRIFFDIEEVISNLRSFVKELKSFAEKELNKDEFDHLIKHFIF